jgi:hypothetical protein
MKCFNHPAAEAVGLCRSCGRALCHDCVAEVGMSVRCRNRCEADVAAINDMVLRGRAAYQKGSALQSKTGMFTVMIGVVLLGFGIFWSIGSEPHYFILVMEALMCAYGVAVIAAVRKLARK